MRVPSHRRLVLSVATGSVVIVAAVVVLGITGVLDVAETLGLAAAALVLGALGAVLIALRWIVQRLSATSRRLSGIEQELTSAHSVLSDDVRPRLRGLCDEVPAMSARLDRLGGLERTAAVTYAQLEAYIDVRSLIRPRGPMPPLRGWAASPDVVRHLAETLQRQRPKLIVECGSGSSGIWLGYFAQQLGAAKVICLEHDERYWRLSRDLVQAHELDDTVEIRLAPLTGWKRGDRTYPWYETEALEDLADIGLLFVDGPPGTTGPQARFPAVPVLMPRCAEDVVIVLDDAERDEELSVSDHWLEEFPELERVMLRFDKGAHVFTRQSL